jgi:ubiquinone/menaquinone biosynthesis C-methylase UbiE
MPQHPPEDEPTRLRRVYGAYVADDANRARWDPEQPGNRLILAERDGLLRDALRHDIDAAPGQATTIVDLGCGTGDVLATLVDAEGSSRVGVGIDLLEDRLREARARRPDLALLAANGTALPLADDTVDVMVVFTVFSSILDRSTADEVAAEVRRVVRPAGRVIWYDLRRDNPRNREVRGLAAADIAELFPGWASSLRTCTVLPPLARRAAQITPRSYRALSRVPVLRSHHFGVLHAPAVDRTGGR